MLSSLRTMAIATALLIAPVNADEFEGNLDVLSADGKLIAHYSIAELTGQFQSRTLTTETPWSMGKTITYQGVSLYELIEKHGLLNSVSIRGRASNDFSAVIFIRDIKAYSPLLALARQCDKGVLADVACEEGNFIPLSMKDYGPIFMVWPFDTVPDEVRDHSKWVWFVKSFQAIGTADAH